MLQLDFDTELTTVRIHRCKYVSKCKARNCLARATLIAEKVAVTAAKSNCARATAKSSLSASVLAVWRFLIFALGVRKRNRGYTFGLESFRFVLLMTQTVTLLQSPWRMIEQPRWLTMTEVEAIRVFDGLRKEYRAMKPGDDRRALDTLLTAHVVPGGLGTSITLALETFRLTFAEIDRWENRSIFRN
jgi:hypothetical protein